MLKLKIRGPWYHVEGKNNMGVKIKRHTINIAVYDRYGKVDKLTRQAAEARVIELEKVTEWPPRKEAPEEPEALKLIDAYNLWLGQGRYVEDSPTWQAYSSVKHVLIEPLTAKGVVFVKDVTSQHLNELQEGWRKKSLNTIHNWRKYTSCLFNYCVNFHDLVKNPWKPVEAITEKKLTKEDIMAGKKQDKGIATLPLDRKGNANWLRIQEAVPAFVRGQLPRQKIRRGNPLLRHPDTFLTMLWLMYETGLRRSDALIFRPDWIVNTRHGGRYITAQVKTSDEVVCFLPQALVDRLRALPCLKWRGDPSQPGAGMYPFFDGSRKDHNNYLKIALDTPLRELGVLLGIEGSLRPHRFRDSFAVNMLNLGLSLEDVRRMLGHRTIATTQKYYAPYVLGMQEAVENRQAAAKQAANFAEACASAEAASVN